MISNSENDTEDLEPMLIDEFRLARAFIAFLAVDLHGGFTFHCTCDEPGREKAVEGGLEEALSILAMSSDYHTGVFDVQDKTGNVFALVTWNYSCEGSNFLKTTAPPTCIIEWQGAVDYLIYRLSGTDEAKAMLRQFIESDARCGFVGHVIPLPVGDWALSSEFAAALETGAALQTYDAGTLLHLLEAAGHLPIQDRAIEILLSHLDLHSFTICDRSMSVTTHFESPLDAAAYATTCGYPAYLSFAPEHTNDCVAGFVIAVENADGRTPDEAWVHQVEITSTAHTYYPYVGEFSAASLELIEKMLVNFKTGPVQVLNLMPLPVGDFRVDNTGLKILELKKRSSGDRVEDAAWAFSKEDRLHVIGFEE